MLLLSVIVNGQYLPAINRIDTMEQNIINKYGDKWLVNFYNVWEAGKTNPQYNEIMIKNIDGNNFKSLLEDDLDCFIINSRLFAISYKPDNAINESENNMRNAYSRDDKNSVWLYEKNVKIKSASNDGKWFTANNSPLFRKILGENCDGNGVAYCPQKTKGTGENFIIKSNKYKGYVVIICKFKSNFKYATRLITFSPTPVVDYPDGYVYYEYCNNVEGRLFTLYGYPVKFTGQDKNGKISTISNTGKIETIQLYLGKSKYGTKIDDTRVSYYSDDDKDGYGYYICYGSGK